MAVTGGSFSFSGSGRSVDVLTGAKIKGFDEGWSYVGRVIVAVHVGWVVGLRRGLARVGVSLLHLAYLGCQVCQSTL